MNLVLLYNLIGICHHHILKNVDEITFYSYYKPGLTIIHGSYFVYDTFIEIFYYNRYVYIIHHVLSLCEIGTLYFSNIDYNTLQQIITWYSWIEVTTFIVNIRDVFKKYKLLNNQLDGIFILIYSYIRGYIFPYYIYYHFLKYTETAIIPIVVYILSMMWLYKWCSSYLKRIKLNF